MAGTTTAKSPLLPDWMSALIRRRLIEACGIAVIAMALGLFAAMISYSPADPSWNTAGPGQAANLLGAFGAGLSDMLLQTLGFSASLIAPILAGWGWRVVTDHRVPTFWIRLVLTPPVILIGSLAFACMPVPGFWPLETGLGGVAGDLMLTGLTKAGLTVDPLLIGLPAALVCLLTSIYLFGVSAAEWIAAARAVRTSFSFLRKASSPESLKGGLNAARDMVLGDGDNRIEPALIPKKLKRDASRAEPVEKRPTNPARIQNRDDPSRDTTAKRKARQMPLDLPSSGGPYSNPPLDILEEIENTDDCIESAEALEQNARLLEGVLEDFGVRGEIVKVRPGPVVTLYELEPAPGTKTSRVIGLADDIARSMSAISVRIATVPGRNVIGIELPNARREMVGLKELLASGSFGSTKAKLPMVLGKDIGGAAEIADLATMPHLLIAGTTGSGKSVGLNAMILSLLYHLPPDRCKFIMVDPKMLELSVYDDIPHLLSPVVTDPKKAVVALKWAVREMEDRYRAMSKLGVRNIEGYNKRVTDASKKGEVLTRKIQTGFDPESGAPVFEEDEMDLTPFPYIVVVVDEMADLMLVAGKEIEASIQRLAQMARAAGIHLIMATQRPSVDVITGTIKANFPVRISFMVTSKIDSRTILGEQGAEQLLGKGDMLFMAGGGRIKRVHGPFVDDGEVEAVCDYLRAQGAPEYVDAVTDETDMSGGFDTDVSGAASFNGVDGLGAGGGSEEDQLYDRAVAIIAQEGKASTSFVQRHLQIGYNRAARIIERMEKEGVVSSANHVGKREVLVGDHSR